MYRRVVGMLEALITDLEIFDTVRRNFQIAATGKMIDLINKFFYVFRIIRASTSTLRNSGPFRLVSPRSTRRRRDLILIWC
jgi:hypothetical protein